MSKIMIAEDDAAILSELCRLLEGAGHEPLFVKDFSDTVKEITDSGADLILLDINLPNKDGQTILMELRQKIQTPVIMVTSRTSEIDEVMSMSIGADDYITKPYNPTLLILKISAVLKRCSGSGAVQQYRSLTVNSAKGSLSDGSRELILTKNEMIIFQLLNDMRGKIVTRDQLMTALWNSDEFVNDNALTVNISRLRTKLAEFGFENAIETRKRQGYVLI